MQIATLVFLTIAMVGCAHPPKSTSWREGRFISDTLLSGTNSLPGSVYTTTIYVVKGGDTLLSIGKRFGLTANELRRLNPMLKTSRLFVGQRLRVAELNEQQQKALDELTVNLKTKNSVADLDRLKDSLKRWDELFINPSPPEMKPVFAIVKERIRERIAELESEANSK